MKNILLVAENNASNELLMEINRLINDNALMKNKIHEVVKKTKNKKQYPQLQLANNAIISDINQIYFYITSNPQQRQSGHNNYDGRRGEYGDYDMNYDDYIDKMLDYENEKPTVRSDFDNEKETRRRRIRDNDNGDDESIEERIDIKNVANKFYSKRENIRPPMMKNGRPVKQQMSKSKSKPKPKPKRKQESSEEYSDDDDSNDYNERYPDGKSELNDYYTSEIRNK